MQTTAINKGVPVKAQNSWITDSFSTYMGAKFYFSLFGVLTTLMGLIPFLGAFMLPFFVAKYADIATRVEKQEELPFVLFFEGLFAKKSIIIIGVLHLIFYAIVMLFNMLLNKNVAESTLLGNILDILCISIIIILVLIIVLAFWLAPIICFKNPDVSALAGLRLSLKAFFCYFNKIIMWAIWMFVGGGVIVGIFIFISSWLLNAEHYVFADVSGILGVLFILVWMPILHLGAYYMYKSLFLTYNEQQ